MNKLYNSNRKLKTSVWRCEYNLVIEISISPYDIVISITRLKTSFVGVNIDYSRESSNG